MMRKLRQCVKLEGLFGSTVKVFASLRAGGEARGPSEGGLDFLGMFRWWGGGSRYQSCGRCWFAFP